LQNEIEEEDKYECFAFIKISERKTKANMPILSNSWPHIIESM